ncbi:MAG: dihydropteroate synthase [Candidatus Aminicenantales bacterium]
MERQAATLDIRGRRFSLGPAAWLMGIVNVTPDSFSDGGAFLDEDRAVDHGLELACAGADVLDVGGESTRPGSLPVPEEEESRRVLPVILRLRPKTGVLISVDTTKAAVARAALDAGADIVNDTSGLRADAAMAPLIAKSGAAVILMHMKGVPRTMQESPRYDDLLGEIKAFLSGRIREAVAAGIPVERTIVDPGIGFGKTAEHNLAVLNRLDVLQDLGRPVCVGPSRKAFIGRILGLPPGERLEGSIAAAVISVCRGAHILRVHDVGAVAKAVRVAEAILAAPGGFAAGEKGGKDERAADAG